MPHIVVNGVTRHLRSSPPRKRPPHHHLLGVALGATPPEPPPSASARQAALPVFDQGAANDCVANSTAALLMHIDALEGRPVTVLSRLFLYYATRVWIEGQPATADNGSENADAIKAVTLYGVPDESLWPYDLGKLSVAPPTEVSLAAKKRLAMVEWGCATLRAIKLSIAQGFPVTCAIPVAKSFEASPGTVFPVPTDADPPAGYHSILLDEYDDGDGTVGLRNSWGVGVGEGGFFRIPYAMFGADQDTLLGDGTWASDSWTVRSETEE